MIIPCNYWVNVAKDGRYQCKVKLDDILSEKAKEKYETICKKFPESEGWKCVLHYTTCYSEVVKK